LAGTLRPVCHRVHGLVFSEAGIGDELIFILMGFGSASIPFIRVPEKRRFVYLAVLTIVPALLLYEAPGLFCTDSEGNVKRYTGMMVCQGATEKDIPHSMKYHDDEFLSSLALGYGLVKDENIPRFVNAAYYAQWSSTMGVAGYLALKVLLLFWGFIFNGKKLEKNVPDGSAERLAQESGLPVELMKIILAHSFSHLDKQGRLILDDDHGLEKIWSWGSILGLIGIAVGLSVGAEDAEAGLAILGAGISLALLSSILDRMTNNYLIIDFIQRKILYHSAFSFFGDKEGELCDFARVEKFSVDHTYEVSRGSVLWVEYFFFIHVKNKNRNKKRRVFSHIYKERHMYKVGGEIFVKIAEGFSSNMGIAFDKEQDYREYDRD
jgi:hypothetical protein